jgi:integral membrane protein (TIGR01906 family)
MTEHKDVSEHLRTANLSYIRRLVAWLVVLAVPIWLSLTATRLLVSQVYLQFEYAKPDFPADPYGFTQADRLAYAPYAIDYLTNGSDISFLGDLNLADGSPMYNERELGHMADVKAVMQVASTLYGLLSVALVAGVLWLYMTTRKTLCASLKRGAYLTLALIVGLVVLAALGWDTFFTTFHRLFFTEGTWRFLYSDTLIRLFPERFWFDAAITIGILVTVGAMLILLIITVLERRSARRNT